MNDTAKVEHVIHSPRGNHVGPRKGSHKTEVILRPKPQNGIRIPTERPITPSFVPYTNRAPVAQYKTYARTEDLVTEDLTTFVSETSPKASDSELRRLCIKSPVPLPRARTVSPSFSVEIEHPSYQRRSISSPKFNAQPVEDPVEVVMPNNEPDPYQFTLYNAPPCLKRNPVRPLGLERSPANGSKPFGTKPRPAVVERRQLSMTSRQTSPFSRSASLPAHVVRRVSAERAVKAVEGKLSSGVQRKPPQTFDRSLSEDSRPRKLHIIRQTQHDESKIIEIERASDVRTFSPEAKLIRPIYDDSQYQTVGPSDGYSRHSYTQQSHFGTAVNGQRINPRSPSPQTCLTHHDRTLIDRVDGLNSPYLDGIRTAPTRSKEVHVRRTAFVNSAPQSPATEPRSYLSESRNGGATMIRNGMSPSGLPPVPNRVSSNRMSRTEQSLGVDHKLTPIGPPVEEVTVRIDPETGNPVKVTSRSQSFTDLDQTTVITKTDEIIEKEDGTEHCTKQRTVRKVVQNSPRERRTANRLERHSESVRSSRVLRSKLYDDTSPESPTRQTKVTGDATPYRATSQTNIAGRTTLGQQPWSSEMNIRTSTSYKNTPLISNYSAHRENMTRREDQRRFVEDGTSRQYSSRCYDESKGTGTAEILEEMETITLQPIGRGVHDLEPVRSIARSYRANTPTASRAFTPGPDNSDGYRTIATTHMQREMHSPGVHSPYIGARHNSFFEARTSENQFAASPFPEQQQWRASTVPPNYAASTSGASGFGDSTDWEQGLMKLVRETYREWYMPDKKREDIHFLLRDREPGAFIIRNSVSCANSFSLGVKSPPPPPLLSANPEYMKSGPIKHFMIQTIPMQDGRTEGVQLRGFEDQPIFPGLVQFVHHHCLHPGPLPCQLRLPVTSPATQTRMGPGYFGSLTKYGANNPIPTGGSGMMLHMLYLGSVNVDRLENDAAIRRAITHILTQSAISVTKLTKRCDVVVTANPQDGVRIHDRAKRGLLEKHIKPTQIVYCGLDPESRLYTDPELRTRGIFHARTFGLVVRKKQFWMHGNMVYVLTEIDPSQSALSLVQYINQVFVS